MCSPACGKVSRIVSVSPAAPPATPSAALSPPVTPVPTGIPLDAFPPRSAAACARSWSDLAAARSALVLEIGAAPANPPPATRCHAPPQSLRNIRSAASENTAPALAKDAPSPPRRSAHTAPLQTRRTHAPPAVGSTAGRTDVPPSAAIACGQSKTLPALAAAPLFVPSPCTQFTNLRSGLRKKLHERIQTFTTDC